MRSQEIHHRLIDTGSFTQAQIIEDDQSAGSQMSQQVFETILCGLINVHIQVAKRYIVKI